MELKDMIISTLAELDKDQESKEQLSSKKDISNNTAQKQSHTKSTLPQETINTNEKEFLHSVRERVLVLFEGLQSPQNQNLDIKLDITLNFLEFLLALVEERIKGLQASGK